MLTIIILAPVLISLLWLIGGLVYAVLFLCACVIFSWMFKGHYLVLLAIAILAIILCNLWDWLRKPKDTA